MTDVPDVPASPTPAVEDDPTGDRSSLTVGQVVGVVGRRLGRALLLLLVITAVIYATADLDGYEANPPSTDPADEAPRPDPELSVDRSFVDGYGRWLADAATGDLGRLTFFTDSVSSLVWQGWVTDAEILAWAVAAALAVAGGLAAWGPLRRNRLTFALALLVSSVPAFALGVIFLLEVIRRLHEGHALSPHVALGVVGLALGVVAGCGLFLLIRGPLTAGGWKGARRTVLRALPWGFPVVASMTFVADRLASARGIGAVAFSAVVQSDRRLMVGVLASAALVSVIVAALAGIAGDLLDRRDHFHGGPASTTESLPIPSRPVGVVPVFCRAALGLAAVWLVGLLVIGAGADALAPQDPFRQNLRDGLQGPSFDHFFGTDQIGRDIFSRTIHGADTHFDGVGVGVVVAVVSAAVGVFVGGRLGRPGRAGVRFLIDAGVAVPPLLVALLLLTIRAPGSDGFAPAASEWFTPAVAVVMTPHVARLLVERGWVALRRRTGLQLLGAGALAAAGGVSLRVSIDFLGLGAQPPDASWGGMLQEAIAYLTGQEHLVYGLALLLAVTIGSLHLLGRWALGPPDDAVAVTPPAGTDDYAESGPSDPVSDGSPAEV